MALVVKIGADMTGFDKAMKNFNKELKSMTKDTQALGKQFKDVGSKMTLGITAPVLALGAGAVKTGMDFEYAMSKVGAISGATADDMKLLEEQARDLGATTQFSASEAADGMQYLAMAGFKTNDIIAAMPGLLDLAAAGALDLGAAADITSNIMSGFSMEADEAGHVADVLAKAASSANTDVSQLGEAMKYLAPVANVMGWSMEESTAAIMAVSDAGIQGSMAGQAFASSITRLAKPTSEMERVMDDLSLSFFDTEGHMKSLPTIIGDLEVATADLTDEQKSASLSTLFGAEAYKHWAVLLEKGSDALGENTAMLVGADGAAQDMAATMNDNLIGRLKELQSALEEIGIKIYERLEPALSVMVEWFQKLADWFNNLSPKAMNLVLAITGIVAAIGPLLMIIGTLIIFFGQVSATLGLVGAGFGGLFAPILLVIAAIVGLITVFVLWGDEIKVIWETYILPFFTAIVEILMNTVIPFFISAFNMILEIVRNTFTNVMLFWETILKPTFDAIIQFLMTYVVPFFQTAWDVIVTAVSVAFEIITSLWNDILQPTFGYIVEWLTSILQPTFEAIFYAISTVVEIAFSLIKSVWEGLLQPTFKLIGDFISNVLYPIFKKVFGIIADVVKDCFKFIERIWKEVLLPIFDIICWTIEKTVLPIWKAVFKVISEVVKTAFDLIKGFWNKILKPILEIIMTYVSDVLFPVWEAIFTAIGSVVSDVFDDIKFVWDTVLKPILDGIITFVSGVFTGDWEKAWQGVSDIFGGIFDGLVALAKAPINGVISLINGAFSGINTIKIPDWVPGVGGKGFSFPKIPMLATGGNIFGNGSAIVGEAGPELVSKSGSSVKVTPLSSQEKSRGISGELGGASSVHLHIAQFINNTEKDMKRLMQEANFYSNNQNLSIGRK